MTKRSIEIKTNELRTYHAFNHLIKMLLIQDHFCMNQNKLKIWDYCLILKKSANMGETSMNEIRSIKQSILEIDID